MMLWAVNANIGLCDGRFRSECHGEGERGFAVNG